MPVAFGFHPYLRLPGAVRAAWELRLPPRRHLVLDLRGIPTGTGEREVGLRRVAPGETFAATLSIVVA